MDDIKNTSFKLLSMRSLTSYQLKMKLLSKKYKLNEINTVIKQIIDLGYIDDDYLLKSFIKSRIERGYGPRAIQMKLKNILPGKENVLHEMYTPEIENDRIKHLLAKRGKDGVITPKEREKEFRFLLSRGFSIDRIKDSLLY